MQILSLTLMLLSSACILQVKVASERDSAMMVDPFFELQVLYHLAFEKHAYIQLSELYELDSKTTQALRADNIPPKHELQVRQWHHKLRSYIVFLLTMQPTDDNGVIKTNMSSLLLHRLRYQSPELIDLTVSNQDFYRRMRAGEAATTDDSKESMQLFFGNLLATILTMNQQAINRYHNMFAFEKSEPAALCRQAKYADCQAWETLRIYDPTKALTLDKVTEMVNKTIGKLNRVRAALQRLEVAQTDNQIPQAADFFTTQISAQYQEYELVLMDAAQQNILPIFFTKMFKNMSGTINPYSPGKLQRSDNKLLTEVSAHTTTQAVTELKKELITHWAEIKKARQHQHRRAEKTIYLWTKDHDVAVARLLLQKPRYAPVVNFLFHRYEHEVDDQRWKKIIKAALTTVGVGTLALFATSLVPMLTISALLSKAIMISGIANLGWAALNIKESFAVHNRQLTMERSLLSGTSQQIENNLKMLQEFEAARKNAILSGSIGLSISAGAYNQILKSLNSSSRPLLSKYVRDLFAPKTSPKAPPGIFIDP